MFTASKEAHLASVHKNAHLPHPEKIFTSMLFCADCGKRLKKYIQVLQRESAAQEVQYKYICESCKNNRSDRDKRGYVHHDQLKQAVLETLQKQIQICADLQHLFRRLQGSTQVQKRLHQISQEITQVQSKLKRIRALKLALYNDFSDSLLTESEFLYAQNKYAAEQEAWQSSLEALLAEQEQYQDSFIQDNQWTAAISQFQFAEELTREMLVALVEKIEVRGDKSILLHFNYQDEFQQLETFIKERGEANE